MMAFREYRKSVKASSPENNSNVNSTPADEQGKGGGGGSPVGDGDEDAARGRGGGHHNNISVRSCCLAPDGRHKRADFLADDETGTKRYKTG